MKVDLPGNSLIELPIVVILDDRLDRWLFQQFFFGDDIGHDEVK